MVLVVPEKHFYTMLFVTVFEEMVGLFFVLLPLALRHSCSLLDALLTQHLQFQLKASPMTPPAISTNNLSVLTCFDTSGLLFGMRLLCSTGMC